MKNLRISAHSPKTLTWWFNHREDIHIEPTYQRRGRQWSFEDKAYLIDSIINGFDVPKLYLADFQFGQSALNQAKLPYAVIDGKQRLEAVFDFFEYKFTLNKDFKYRRVPALKLGGMSLKDLRQSYPRVAEDFENASLDIMSVIAEDEADINEIFVRLNKSKPLTGAEVRNAIYGPVPDLIREIAKHEFFVDNIRFSIKRATHFNAAAKLLLFEYFGKLVATEKKDLDEFSKSDTAPEKLELAGRRVLDTLSKMSEIFIFKDPLLASAGVVPVYYWFIREISNETHWPVRSFLLVFEEDRKKNRVLQKHGNDDLTRFDTLSRSANLTSHIGRVNILKDFYDKFDGKL